MRPYTDWEDWRAGMWSSEHGDRSKDAAGLLADPMRLHSAMRRVVREWPVCSEVNLAEPPNNRAWLGQAACCLSVGANEESTRAAWSKLNDGQRAIANRVADSVIAEWKFITKRDAQMEFSWDA